MELPKNWAERLRACLQDSDRLVHGYRASLIFERPRPLKPAPKKTEVTPKEKQDG